MSQTPVLPEENIENVKAPARRGRKPKKAENPASDLVSSLPHNGHPPLRGQLGCENRDDSKRCHGRTRMALPIEPPAPRPCSAAAHRARSHLAGLSDRGLPPTLLFTAFIHCIWYYTPQTALLSTVFSLTGYPFRCILEQKEAVK